MGFTKLGLSDQILKGVSSAGYDTPTPIQALAIQPALEGKDIIGCAQTGHREDSGIRPPHAAPVVAA